MAKKKDETMDETAPLPPEDGQSGVMSLGETPANDAPLDPSRVPNEGDVVVYVPNLLRDNVGAGHCKATVKKNTVQGSQNLTVHGPNGDFDLLCVDRGNDKMQGSWYWGDVDAIEEGRGP